MVLEFIYLLTNNISWNKHNHAVSNRSSPIEAHFTVTTSGRKHINNSVISNIKIQKIQQGRFH